MSRMAALVIATGLVTGMLAEAQDQQKAETKQVVLQQNCPVTGAKTDRTLYVDHNGKRIYVCSKECVATIKQDPEKYLAKLEGDGITVAKVQTTCPVMGGKVDKDTYVDHGGKRIYMCCAGCRGALEADPAKFIKKLESEGVALDPADSATVGKQ